MLLGRRRRYFGYPKDLSGVVDTPESARSFASYLSPAPSVQTQRRRNTILPDIPLPRRYADKHLHAAIATHIPSLLPPLKNTFRFKDYPDNPMRFHTPQLENHFERSLYYIWLAKNDRTELCNIVDAHLGSNGKGNRYKRMSGDYRGIGNPIQRPPPADYTNMPRTMSILDVAAADASKALKSKFQKGIWDPPKTPRDKFVQDHGKSPAMEAICRAYPGNKRTRVTEKDIQDCIFAAKKILGPYVGLNVTIDPEDELPEDMMDLIEETNKKGKQIEEKKKQDGVSKRPFGYNSSQIKYDKQIIAAMQYYNKIKLGQSEAEPPEEIFGKQQFNTSKSVGKSLARMLKLQENNVALRPLKSSNQTIMTSQSSLRSTRTDMGDGGVQTLFPQRKSRFDRTNVTEKDYMDMYLHYLGSEEDVSIKKPKPTLSDVTKLRKKMHLDDDSEDEGEAELQRLLRQDSFSDIQDPIERKLLKGDINASTAAGLKGKEAEVFKEILESHQDKIKSKKMKQLFRYYSVKSLSASAPVSRHSPVSTAPGSDVDLDSEAAKEKAEDDEKFEKEMGFLSEKTADQVVSEVMQVPSVTDSVIDVSMISSSSSVKSSSSQNAADVELPSGKGCDVMDLDCLSEQGALGALPFGRKMTEEPDEKYRNDDAPNTVFSRAHWKDGKHYSTTTARISLKSTH